MLLFLIEIFLVILFLLLGLYFCSLQGSHIISVWRGILQFAFFGNGFFYIFSFSELRDFDFTLRANFVVDILGAILISFWLYFNISCGFVGFLGFYRFLNDFIIRKNFFDVSLYLLVLYFVGESFQPLNINMSAFLRQCFQSGKILLKYFIYLLRRDLSIGVDIVQYINKYISEIFCNGGVISFGNNFEDRVYDCHKIWIKLPIFLLILYDFLQQFSNLLALNHRLILLEELEHL